MRWLLLGKRAIMPAAALPLLAALTPQGHQITLIDENVAPIEFDRCAGADIVGVTGMIVQRRRMYEIIMVFRPTVFDHDVLALDKAGVTKALQTYLESDI